jgi:pilus assembly protein CpaC
MTFSKYHQKKLTFLTMMFVFSIIFTRLSIAANDISFESMETRKINISAGKSIVIHSEESIKRVSIANPDIADFILLSPKEIYIIAKTAGTTNLTLWQDSQIVAIYDLVVGYDIAELKRQLHDNLPEEKELTVMATNNSITLSGKVTDAAALTHALSLAGAYAPDGNIQNLVTVGGVHQVMLEVRVAEMSRSLTKRLGINIFYNRGDEFAISTLGGLADLVPIDNAELVTGSLGWTVSPAVNQLFRFNSGSATWTGLVDALKEDGLIKVLAEPNLITLSGQSANFLAGGEFPVPVPQGLGTAAIEYKPFGVGLVFSPTVLSKDKINIQVSPEVSDLDFTTAVEFQGFVVPGLRTRRATTNIELADGQSFAIAGLLRESMRSISTKVPLLGDIPILGALFQSKSFQKEETELIIIVTPHLVKPLDLEEHPLPTDYYVEPNDIEFYLFGMLEGRAKNTTSSMSGKLDGEFGHSLPE